MNELSEKQKQKIKQLLKNKEKSNPLVSKVYTKEK